LKSVCSTETIKRQTAEERLLGFRTKPGREGNLGKGSRTNYFLWGQGRVAKRGSSLMLLLITLIIMEECRTNPRSG
jgi:hypothetical protein